MFTTFLRGGVQKSDLGFTRQLHLIQEAREMKKPTIIGFSPIRMAAAT